MRLEAVACIERAVHLMSIPGNFSIKGPREQAGLRTIIIGISVALLFATPSDNARAQSTTPPAVAKDGKKEKLDPARSRRKANIGIAEQPPLRPPPKANLPLTLPSEPVAK